MDQEEENVTTLLSMGFQDVKEIRKAVRLSKNDLNEAISILTNEHSTYDSGDVGSFKVTKPDLPPDYPGLCETSQSYENQMTVRSDDCGDAKSSYGKNLNEPVSGKSLEFPSANLYELESRVFCDQWSIPYKREESFGKCLIAATNLASEGLCEVDENCKHFLENCMPEAFRKLLTSAAVRTWGPEVQEGVYNMVQLFIDFIVVRLKFEPVPERLLHNVLVMVFDPESEFHIKNKSRSSANAPWDEVNYENECYAKSYAAGDPYGWLVNLINKFGDQAGFESMQEKFVNAHITPSAMSALLKPFSKCVQFLVGDKVSSFLLPCITKAEQYIRNLKEDDLKSKNICVITELLKTVNRLCQHLWIEEADSITALHLSVILRMLKCSQFNARMNGLKEIQRLIDESTNFQSAFQVISSDKLLEWISENRLLSLSLESNLDQAQYAEKITVIVDFLGPRLSLDDITKIWSIQEGQNVQTVDNILNIMAAASTKFNGVQFDHLLSLIQKSWQEGHEQARKRLICFIGKIGKETNQGKASPKVLDLLWDLAHSPELPTYLVEQALEEEVNVLNKLLSQKEQTRKNYILRCVEDIKKGTCVLPCLKMLHNISSSIAQHGYQKQDKAALSDLNKSHDLIKLVTTSMSSFHKQAVTTPSGTSIPPLVLSDAKYSHEEYITVHLDFLKFILQEGSQYLSWGRAQDVWDALITNVHACESDRETCFEWFTRCLQDLEIDTQSQLFQQKILKLDSAQITQRGFNCFKSYFESVNMSENKLRRFGTSLMVEKMDLIGLDFLWQVALDCPDETIAEYAIANILDVSYHSLSPKLKKDPIILHQKFSSECSKRLEAILLTVGAPMAPSPVMAAVSCATKTLTAMSVSEAALPMPSRSKALQNIRRLLQLAECYVSSIEDLHRAPRTILPHGASFHGYPVLVQVVCDLPDRELTLLSHSNETLGSLQQRIAYCLQIAEDQVHLTLNDSMNYHSKKQKLLCQLGFQDFQLLHVKTSGNPSSSVTYNPQFSGSYAASTSAAGVTSRLSFHFEQEKMLPGVVMSTGGHIYNMLYQLVCLGDPKIILQVQNLLHLLPTDPSILNLLDSVSDQQAQEALSAPEDTSKRNSPRTSPKKLALVQKEADGPKDVLKKLFDLTFNGMSPFRLLYNIQVLSGKLMPTIQDPGTIESAKHFCDDFLKAGGLQFVINILQNEDLPTEINYDTIHGCYFLALQIACYLLCGVEVVDTHKFCTANFSPIKPAPKVPTVHFSFPPSLTKPQFPSTISNVRIIKQAIKTFPKDGLVDLILSVIRICWVAAGGQVQLGSCPLVTKDLMSRVERTRHSGTSSSRSSGSEDGHYTHSEVSSQQQSVVSKEDSRLAKEALAFLVTCFQLRPDTFDSFVSLPRSADFIKDMILSSPSEDVRSKALEQFSKLSKLDNALFSHARSPRHYLLNVLRTAQVPLWLLSSITRSVNLRLLNQSKEFFELLCELVNGCSKEQQETFNFDAKCMLTSEIEWLQNFTTSEISSLKAPDNTLLCGHFKLLKHLLSCEGVEKEEIGESLILDILNQFLFRASHLIVEGTESHGSTLPGNLTPKCSTLDSRIAAYDFLTQLATGCARNLEIITNQLIKLHHHFKPGLSKDYEYEPLVAGRAPCGYVGLKNAGATCYMNSVLQQLYMQPGVREAILSVDEPDSNEDSLFYQLQMVFGHLLESQLQYHTPEKFWKCFRLWGQPVNLREQQDAFEFFSHVVDQVDEYLGKYKREPIFKQKYEGVFSDQKICQGCCHRYEREETFMALNLPIKTHNLLHALDQFIKEETLEGDNAYFCEKCGEKRTTIKRTCIQNLPPVLVIQLKRFGYDWEANRAMKFDDYFKFPWMVDMKPYTLEGVQKKVSGSSEFREPMATEGQQSLYELVGVIVHTGQANAGHYYSYIKERSSDPNYAFNKGKWFKFNDTTVEEYDMTNESLEAECFGGTYKAMFGGDSGSSYPETRQRYWNGYMLFYEAREDLNKAPWTPRKTPMQMQLALRSGEKDRTGKKSPVMSKHRDSLSQLTRLVDRGEQQGLFVDTVPARIQRVVRENNLQFMHNCDIYNDAYFNFVHNLVKTNIDPRYSDDTNLLVYSMQLGIHFLLNTYLRTRNKPVDDWLDDLETILKICKQAAMWFMDYLGTDIGLSYLKPFLLECPNRDVRQAFANLLEKEFHYYFKYGGKTDSSSIDKLIEHILQMLNQDVPDNCRNCNQYFRLLSTYAQLGKQTCIHLFQKNAFQRMLDFLLSPVAANMEKEGFFPRRWGSLQAKEFGPLYSTFATLVLGCNLLPHQTCNADTYSIRESSWRPCKPDIPLPESVSAALYGPGSGRFVHEIVNACREISGPMPMIMDMLVLCCFCNEHFSYNVIKQIMLQYSSVPSNELRNLSSLLLEILQLEDPLQFTRVQNVIDGFTDNNGAHIGGMLDIIHMNQQNDGRRSYQGVKFLVVLARKCVLAKDYLIQTPGKWQWAVNWLKRMMSEHTNLNNQSITLLSNEDSNTKTFQRTVSAQDTLADATALLTELETSENQDVIMDVDDEESSPGESQFQLANPAYLQKDRSLKRAKAMDDLDAILP